MRVLLYIIFILTVTMNSYSQPQNDWMRFYGGNFQDVFADVFRNTDGGYSMAGQFESGNRGNYDMWIVRTMPDGEQLWSRQYGTGGYEAGSSLIQTDAGGFFSGGITGSFQNWDFAGVLTDGDGEEIWWRRYGGESSEQCNAVIELKDGNFLMAGYTESFGAGGRDGYLIKIDIEGNLIWEQTYGFETNEEFYAMREIDDGVLLAGYTTLEGNQDFWLVRADNVGEEVWSRNFGGEGDERCMSLISCTGGGFAMAGYIIEGEANMWLVRLDREMNPIWDSVIDADNGEFGNREYCYTHCQNIDEGFTLAGIGRHGDGTVSLVARTDNAGNLMWTRQDRVNDGANNQYKSTILAPDGSIIIAGSASVENLYTQGLLVKLVPERSAPVIISFVPEEQEFSVLHGDTVYFEVEAVDAQNDDLSYIWTLNGEEVSDDTCYTHTFDELRDNIMQCTVSDGDQEVSVAWLIDVKEFFIRSFEPDSLELTIQRGNEIDFWFTIAALEEIEVENTWTLTHRNQQQEELGDGDAVSVTFDQSGRHQLQALVSREDQSDEVTWVINVRSAVWSWWPSEFELSAYKDSTLEFVITPFNEDSDSLEYVWLLDGEQLGSDSALVLVTFLEVGQSELTSIVHDGVEADTISWTVNVEEWSFTADDADFADLPTSPVLYPASPNPFNSAVKLSMYLPKADHVSLSIFDINGREVSRLVDGIVGAGSRTFVWNASDFPTGVYVVRMEAGSVSEMRKVVLVR